MKAFRHSWTASAELDAPIHEVWRHRFDLDELARANPAFEELELIEGPIDRVGARIRVVAMLPTGQRAHSIIELIAVVAGESYVTRAQTNEAFDVDSTSEHHFVANGERTLYTHTHRVETVPVPWLHRAILWATNAQRSRQFEREFAGEVALENAWYAANPPPLKS